MDSGVVFTPVIPLSPEEANYLDSAARLRGISRSRLVARLIKMIAQDQMVLGILDDESDVVNSRRAKLLRLRSLV